MNPADVRSALTWRYATKQFDPERTLEPEVLDALLESLRMTPSSFGLQPWKFIVITDPAVKSALRQHSWDQPQVEDCSHLVVLCARKSVDEAYIDAYVDFIASTRSVPLESLDAYKGMMKSSLGPRSDAEVLSWTQRQVYIAQGFLLLTAANLQVDACPMEGFEPAEYDKVLNLEGTDYTSTVVVPLGYRKEDDKYGQLAKVRFGRDEVFEFLD